MLAELDESEANNRWAEPLLLERFEVAVTLGDAMLAQGVQAASPRYDDAARIAAVLTLLRPDDPDAALRQIRAAKRQVTVTDQVGRDSDLEARVLRLAETMYQRDPSSTAGRRELASALLLQRDATSVDRACAMLGAIAAAAPERVDFQLDHATALHQWAHIIWNRDGRDACRVHAMAAMEAARRLMLARPGNVLCRAKVENAYHCFGLMLSRTQPIEAIEAELQALERCDNGADGLLASVRCRLGMRLAESDPERAGALMQHGVRAAQGMRAGRQALASLFPAALATETLGNMPGENRSRWTAIGCDLIDRLVALEVERGSAASSTHHYRFTQSRFHCRRAADLGRANQALAEMDAYRHALDIAAALADDFPNQALYQANFARPLIRLLVMYPHRQWAARGGNWGHDELVTWIADSPLRAGIEQDALVARYLEIHERLRCPDRPCPRCGDSA